MVIGQLVARPVPEIHPPDDAQLGEKIKCPVYCHHPYPRTAPPQFPHALVLLCGERL